MVSVSFPLLVDNPTRLGVLIPFLVFLFFVVQQVVIKAVATIRATIARAIWVAIWAVALAEIGGINLGLYQLKKILYQNILKYNILKVNNV